LSFNSIEARIDLGFGVSITKCVRVEGIDRDLIKSRARLATHCMVVLIGGKRILVHVGKSNAEGPVVGRVYLDEKVYHEPEGYVIPLGLDAPKLEIGIYMTWLAAQGFDIAVAKRTLNGR